jgi:hypothetical protein
MPTTYNPRRVIAICRIPRRMRQCSYDRHPRQSPWDGEAVDARRLWSGPQLCRSLEFDGKPDVTKPFICRLPTRISVDEAPAGNYRVRMRASTGGSLSGSCERLPDYGTLESLTASHPGQQVDGPPKQPRAYWLDDATL